MFVRKLPPNRSYLIFAGLEQAIGTLLDLRFSDEQIESIRHWPAFEAIDPAWFDQLRQFHFTGDVWSVPEGTVVFANEPLLRVTAPLAQAQLVETILLASLGYPTLVASKASRIVEAARGRSVVDFGARRGMGRRAGFLNARASYIAGFSGTSHVEAARRLGIPAVGTMAHAWVQAFESETIAFQTFARHFPKATTLLVDTYDIDQGVRNAAAIEPPIQAIRIDSGDLVAGTKLARAILDSPRSIDREDPGEQRPRRDQDRGVAGGRRRTIDAFGVGTELITSRDAPAISMVYKLVELDGVGRIKKSAGKRSYPMAKQIYRHSDSNGKIAFDRVTRADEEGEGEPLLSPVLRSGTLVAPLPALERIRERCRNQRESLPASLRILDSQPPYPIQYSEALETEAARLGLL